MGNCDSTLNTEEVNVNLLNYHEELRHFYVICVVYNPARSPALMKTYLKFKKHMETFNVHLITVECAFENSPFVITRPGFEPDNIQLRTSNTFYQKENFINIAISKLPKDAKYVVWCDCDIEFCNLRWVEDTIKALNMYKAVQVCKEVILVDEKGKQTVHQGFAARMNKLKRMDEHTLEQVIDHATYAWGFRYEALKELKGLIDFSPIGNNEKIMAYCLAQSVERYIPLNVSEIFRDEIKMWELKASVIMKTGVGFVPGIVRVNNPPERKENNWKILQDNKFDHVNDFYKDKQGIYCIEARQAKLKEDLKHIFKC